jgi:glycosyltransferase involved in cell wall biosynthesis
MRIAYLIHHDVRGRFGGSEVYARALAEAAADAGHEVLVICRGDAHGRPLEYADEAKFRLAVLDERALAAPRALFRLRETYDNPRAMTLLAEALGAFQPAHLHIHHLLMTSVRVVDWARERRVPVTATLHDYWAFCHRITWQLPNDEPCPGPLGGWRCRGCGKAIYNRWPGRLLQPAHAAGFVARNAALRHAYAHMKAVFAPSRTVLWAHRAHGFEAAKLAHRPYGLARVERAPRLQPHRRLAVGYIGRLSPDKGVETLIDAARSGTGFGVDVFGHGDDAYVRTLRQRAAGAPVVFQGAFDHAELNDILARIDVLAAPSRWRENQPLALLEAAAHGVPTVVSAIGGLREADELCGALLLPPDDVAAWARVLSDLARDRRRLAELQEHARYDRRIEDDLQAHLEAGR